MDNKHSNHLAGETSPYLLQHARNPVDWYPWNEGSLGKAKTENKLMIISIGYAACHWCHVMEKESFEDPEVAAAMNADYISVKVDREERPDVDQVYMHASYVVTGTARRRQGNASQISHREVWNPADLNGGHAARSDQAGHPGRNQGQRLYGARRPRSR